MKAALKSVVACEEASPLYKEGLLHFNFHKLRYLKRKPISLSKKKHVYTCTHSPTHTFTGRKQSQYISKTTDFPIQKYNADPDGIWKFLITLYKVYCILYYVTYSKKKWFLSFLLRKSLKVLWTTKKKSFRKLLKQKDVLFRTKNGFVSHLANLFWFFQ